MSITINERYAHRFNAVATSSKNDDILLKIAQEFKDRSRKDIRKWRDGLEQAENPENPRWYAIQDVYDDLTGDAHLSSVMDVRKATTLNNRFYVVDENGDELSEQTALLDKKWFYDFLGGCLDAIFRKYAVMQFYKINDTIAFDIIPYRNVCPQKKRVYLEITGDKFIDYTQMPNILEIVHSSPFGLLNDVVPNVIWKRNSIQSWAEFAERYGNPLIIATTSNRAEATKIEQQLKLLGEAASGVFPFGTSIDVKEMATKGDPYNTYLRQIELHDEQVSKRFIGGTMVTDNGSSRAQSEVMERTLDDKIGAADKRFIRFIVNDNLFPILKNLGLPFDPEKTFFQFDETEGLTLTEQWQIVSEAMNRFELDNDWIGKTFNLPIIKEREQVSNNNLSGFSSNFQ